MVHPEKKQIRTQCKKYGLIFTTKVCTYICVCVYIYIHICTQKRLHILIEVSGENTQMSV